MPAAPAPLINGRRYSFSSIELAIKAGASAQEIVTDVSDISYSESLVISFMNGTARTPIGSTAGVWEAQEGSLLIGKSSVTNLIQTIGPGYMGINAIILATYLDIGEILTTDTIVCRLFTGLEDAHTYGPDPLKQSVKFMPLTPILRNGISGMLNRVV